MNIRAAKFVQNLRGLSPSEKAVAFSMAVHADFQKTEATMSMTTLAEESGLKNRQTASLIVKRLETAGVIRTAVHSKGGRSQTTTYVFTFATNRDSGVTVTDNRNSPVAVSETETATLDANNCNSDGDSNAETATQNAETATPQLHEGFEGKRKKGGEKVTAAAKPTPPSASSEPKAPHGGQSKRHTVDEAVTHIIQTAKSLNKAAAFSGKSKQALRDALIELKGCNYAELDAIVREKIQQCDDFALQNFGSSLAAELVGYIRARRQHEAVRAQAADEERRWKQWQTEFELVRHDSTIDLDVWYEAHFYLVAEARETEAQSFLAAEKQDHESSCEPRGCQDARSQRC